MLGKELFEKALSIESPWFINRVNFDEFQKRLDIYIDFDKGSTFFYSEGEIEGYFKVHDTKKKTWRHLNFFEHECYLHARVPRIKTDSGKVRLITVPWAGKMNGFTMLFEALLLELCESMPIKHVENLTNVSDDKLWRMLEKYVNLALEEKDFSDVQEVGVDETSRKKGHNYITLFVDMKKRETMYIAEGKDSSTFKDFVTNLEQQNGNANNIKRVSSDMSKSFKKGVKENLKNAETTFDKFHIIKMLNNAVNDIRKEEVKKQTILKKAKYVLLKNEENLTEKERKKYDEVKLSKLNLKSERAQRIRLAFKEIYDQESYSDYKKKLKEWYFWATHSRLQPIIDVAKTLKEHWEGILNWYYTRLNNGILEGINSLIQTAKRRARGYRDPKNLKIIAYLLTANLDFSRINSGYNEIN